jgi:small subunit ribosomal protein S6
MRRYETIFIVDSDLAEQDRQIVFDKTTEIVSQFDGFVAEIDEWGTRKLAYEIKKKKRGYYTRLDYCGTGAMVDEIERSFRIDDRVLKFMTVLLDNEVDVDRLKAELEEKKAAETQAETAEPAAEPAAADSTVAAEAPAPEAAEDAPAEQPEETTETEEK